MFRGADKIYHFSQSFLFVMLKEKEIHKETQIGIFFLMVYVRGEGGSGCGWVGTESSAHRIRISKAPEKIKMFFIYWAPLYSSMLRPTVQMCSFNLRY